MDDQDFELIPVQFDPFIGPEIAYVVSTTESQKEIWLSCVLGGEEAAKSYNESITIELIGELNQSALSSAFCRLLLRHESLRANFSNDGMLMIIYHKRPVQLKLMDLSGLIDTDRKEVLDAFALSDMDSKFDLNSEPLIRPVLFKLGAAHYQLRLTAHHLICDGWSMGVIIFELSKLYSAFASNELPILSLPPSYSAFAIAQFEHSLTAEYLNMESYWVKQFTPLPPILELPADLPRPAVRCFKSQRKDFVVASSLVSAVKKQGAKVGCSFVTTLLAAFEVLISYETNQDDIVIGLPAAAQSAIGIENLIGHCVNLLALRSQPRNTYTFSEYLRLRKAELLNAYDHQQYTFGSLLKKLILPRDRSRIPLVAVTFNIDIAMDLGVSFAKLRHRLISNPRAFETFEISLNAFGSEEALILEWSYNTQLFTAGKIDEMMQRYEAILQRIKHNADTTLGELKSLQPSQTY